MGLYEKTATKIMKQQLRDPLESDEEIKARSERNPFGNPYSETGRTQAAASSSDSDEASSEASVLSDTDLKVSNISNTPLSFSTCGIPRRKVRRRMIKNIADSTIVVDDSSDTASVTSSTSTLSDWSLARSSAGPEVLLPLPPIAAKSLLSDPRKLEGVAARTKALAMIEVRRRREELEAAKRAAEKEERRKLEAELATVAASAAPVPQPPRANDMANSANNKTPANAVPAEKFANPEVQTNTERGTSRLKRPGDDDATAANVDSKRQRLRPDGVLPDGSGPSLAYLLFGDSAENSPPPAPAGIPPAAVKRHRQDPRLAAQQPAAGAQQPAPIQPPSGAVVAAFELMSYLGADSISRDRLGRVTGSASPPTPPRPAGWTPSPDRAAAMRTKSMSPSPPPQPPTAAADARLQPGSAL
ncbi:hypothetical protein HK405_011685, partial [Cladochytrium tenue]